MLETLRPYYFSDDVDPAILAEADAPLCVESPRALLDLSLRLHWQLPERGGTPLLVLGAEGDRICTPDDVRATARHHGVDATIAAGARAHDDAGAASGRAPARALRGGSRRCKRTASGQTRFQVGASAATKRLEFLGSGSGLLTQKPWKQWQPRACEEIELRLRAHALGDDLEVRGRARGR